MDVEAQKASNEGAWPPVTNPKVQGKELSESGINGQETAEQDL